MNGLRDRFGVISLFLLLATALLNGCEQRSEISLRGSAKDFITALDVEIVEEEHDIAGGLANDEPSSFITSEYVVSDTPEELREKLRAFHLAEDNWLAAGEDGWIGDVQLEVIEHKGRPTTPAEFEKGLGFGLLRKRDTGVDFLLICPWLKASPLTSYSSLYSDMVLLTEEGTLIILLHDRAQSRCYDVDREE